jgi:hypothetical protein
LGIRSPSVNPSSPCSSTNAVIPLERVPGATVANTTYHRASGAPLIHVFVPFSR